MPMKKLTKEEQKTAKKISLILSQEILFYNKVPKGRKDSKTWMTGVLFGMKYMTVRVSELAGVKSFSEKIKNVVKWKKAQEDLFAKNIFKEIR
jgi:hypothetical protein